jgi:hypothetical protein
VTLVRNSSEGRYSVLECVALSSCWARAENWASLMVNSGAAGYYDCVINMVGLIAK